MVAMLPWLTKQPKDPNFTGVSFGRYFINGQMVDEGAYHAYQASQKQQPKPKLQAQQAGPQQSQQPKQELRHNPDLDDVFGSTSELVKQQPKQELRHNPELDDFFGEAPKEQAKPQPVVQKPSTKPEDSAPKKQEQTQPVTPTPTPQQPKPTAKPAVDDPFESYTPGSNGVKGQPQQGNGKTPPPLPRREDTIPRPRTKPNRKGIMTQGVNYGGKKHTVRFTTMQQRKAFEAMAGLKNPRGQTVATQHQSKENAKVKLQQFADKHFGGDIKKATQYAEAEYNHVIGKIKNSKTDVVDVGRLPPKYAELPTPSAEQLQKIREAAGLPNKQSVTPPELPQRNKPFSWLDEGQDTQPKEHEQTQQDALQKANAALAEVKKQTATGGKIDWDKVRQAHKLAHDAINAHQVAGNKAIDQMAIDKYGYTPKAKQIAHQSKQAFAKKLETARQKLKDATFGMGPPAQMPAKAPPLPNESMKFDWSDKPAAAPTATKEPTPTVNTSVPQPELTQQPQEATNASPTDSGNDSRGNIPSVSPVEKPQPQAVQGGTAPTPTATTQPVASSSPAKSTEQPKSRLDVANSHQHAPTPPKREKFVHPDLASTEAFRNAKEHHQELLRDIHANNLHRSAKSLEGAIHRQNREIEKARENPYADDLHKEESIGKLLYEMHHRAEEREKHQAEQKAQQRDADRVKRQQQRRDEKDQRKKAQQEQQKEIDYQENQRKMREEEPGRIRENKLRHQVALSGGIDPSSIKQDHDYKEDVAQGGLLHLMRKNGMRLDKLAQELEADGYFKTPEGRHADDYLMELLKADANHDKADLSHELAYAEHQHQKAQEEARDAGHSEAEIASHSRSGSSSGLLASQDEFSRQGKGSNGADTRGGEGSEATAQYRSPEDHLDTIEAEQDAKADDFDREGDSDADFRDHDARQRDMEFNFGVNDPDYQPEQGQDFSAFQEDLRQDAKPTEADMTDAWEQSLQSQREREAAILRQQRELDAESDWNRQEHSQAEEQRHREDKVANTAHRYNQRFRKKEFGELLNVELAELQHLLPWLSL